eukprot:5342672-Prymnesium_polylepis.1
MDGRAGTRGHWCRSCYVPGVTGRSRRLRVTLYPWPKKFATHRPRTGHVPATCPSPTCRGSTSLNSTN